MKTITAYLAAAALITVPGPLLCAGTLELAYSTYLGGSDDDYGEGVLALGTGGEAYVTGTTISGDFPTQNPCQPFNRGSDDVFVSKLSSSGSVLIYSTYFGGSASDVGQAGIAVSAGGEVYAAGYTDSTDFPTLNPYQASGNNVEMDRFDIFMFKLSSSGSALIYSTYLGGSLEERGWGLSLNTSGEAGVTGWTASTDFPTVNAYQPSHGGEDDAFVSVLSSSGSSLEYSTYLGGSSDDIGMGIMLGTGGGDYVTGGTISSDFPTVSPYQAILSAQIDVFVSKLGSAGSSLIYSTYLGGADVDCGLGITSGAGGEASVAGFTGSTDFPIENPYQSSFGGFDADGFVFSLGSAGSSLIYSTYLGGNYDDYAWGIALSPGGEAYVTGFTDSIDFPTVHPYQSSGHLGAADAFVSRLSSSGSALTYSTYLGGSSVDIAYGIALGLGGEAYISGLTNSSDFPTVNPYQAVLNAQYDVFVSKLIFLTTPSPTPEGYQTPTPIPAPTCGPSLPPDQTVIASGDYNGDGTADMAVFRPSTGLWSLRGVTSAYYGTSADQAAPGDYDGDGSSDIAVFRPGNGGWLIRGLTRLSYGTSGDISVPGDYDGDGVSDVAIFRPSTGQWSIRDQTIMVFGTNGDWPVPGDYDAGGSQQMAVYRPGWGYWAVSGLTRFFFGGPDDWALALDYDGDGIDETAVFRPCNGLWALRGLTRHYTGICTDWPRPADYDGNGADDLAIFRDYSALWAVRELTRVYFGGTGDIPVTR